MQNDLDLFKESRLSDAILHATEGVKSDQTDIVLRSRLVEYLCISSQFERADRQLEVIASQDPKTTVRVMELRQLIRASKAREDLWGNGRLPEFISTPPEHVDFRLRALVSWREGNFLESAEWLKKAESSRPQVSGEVDGIKFDDFRDLDDFFGGVLEVTTSSGKYFWVPIEHILEANFSSPSRPINLIWSEVDLTLSEGPSGVVYVPAIYPKIETNNRETLITGRETDWLDRDGGIVRGQGLRCFMVGDESLSVHEIKNLKIG
jgi:type VI secretion system protein ImpE